MRNSFPAIVFLCTLMSFIATISSCQRELNFEPSGPDTPLANTSTDTIYIDRIVRARFNGTSYDTIMITVFSYDSLRRLKSWRDHPVISSGYPESMEFIYSGKDTLPYRAKYTSKATGSTDSVIQLYHFFYDTHSRKIKDSVEKISTTAPLQSGWVDQFYYPAGKSVTIGRYADANSEYLYKDTSALDALNNITEVKFYSGATGDYAMHCTFQFDNKNHIFSQSNIRNAVPKNTGGYFAHRYSGANNRIYQKLDYFTSYDEVNNTITYNRYDFPLTIEGLYSHEQLKMFFYYRTLQ